MPLAGIVTCWQRPASPLISPEVALVEPARPA